MGSKYLLSVVYIFLLKNKSGLIFYYHINSGRLKMKILIVFFLWI